MNKTRLISLLALQPLLVGTTFADPFDCGSTGADGAMNITTNTILNLPPNGIFNYTTITVATGVTLTFNRNGLNTPVYLLATGDVTINGTIDVSGSAGSAPSPGRGGPGGFDGGFGGSVIVGQNQGGDGLGPGGGRSGVTWMGGAFGTIGPNGGYTNLIYGNMLLVPLVGGSGGAGQSGSPGGGGGGGGGAVLIASNTRILANGSIKSCGAQFGSGGYGSGSGGAIRLVAPTVGGGGNLNTAGGPGGYMDNNPVGGNGRIRIDCTDHRAYLNLALTGIASRGNRMFVFPAVLPHLDIIDVAGQAIPEGTNNAVQFELPEGSSTNQTVTVQARNFTNDVPIRVVVTPRNGPSGQFDAVLSQASGNPSSTNVNVVIPAGSICQIHAWTR